MICLDAYYSGTQLAKALAEDGEELGYALVELSKLHAGETADQIEESANLQVAEWLIELGTELNKLHEAS